MARADYYLTKPYSPEYLFRPSTDLLLQPPRPPYEENMRPLEVVIGIDRHEIKASRQQMLSLLLSTYGNGLRAKSPDDSGAKRELRGAQRPLREQSQQIIDQQTSSLRK
jgi:hypothetical protein